MRAVFRLPAAFVIAAMFGLAAPSGSSAQRADDPSVINPDAAPPGSMPELPMPDMPMPPDPGDQGPMVRPAPDADPDVPPEAFGGPLEDGDAADALSPEGDPSSTDLAEPAERAPETLDNLFSDLKKAGDEREARRTARKIQKRWQESGSATVDLLMLRATQAMGHKQPDIVLDLLDQAIILEPDFAEAWNRRATAHFASGAFGKSIADIEQTLAREPRHWGALMGLALILERTGNDEKALEVYREVLDVYPALQSAQDAVGRLAEKLTGPAI
ncbi:tetratricopeptide repeat protein [Fulvimarina sp. 2208YS6-2-32]|uniref:Tetratricopeptide repeat protein n=1 Tax=Fulvimarina uroteuthidis TaxID=3098149 RepID=A0ABU5HX72_9HYPH|nr:tetratricopeptide repeat protein [Fulvimarina sp. 2208YS6-2-32]MDY8107734.1 tetratricopeptide repeat protein [Fulvimarina sp. 2208YS6-2-32]